MKISRNLKAITLALCLAVGSIAYSPDAHAEQPENIGALATRISNVFHRLMQEENVFSEDYANSQYLAAVEFADPLADRIEDNRRGMFGFAGVHFGSRLLIPGITCKTGFRPTGLITQRFNLWYHLDTVEKELYGAAIRLYAETYNTAVLEAKAYTKLVHQVCDPVAPKSNQPVILDAGPRPITRQGPVRLEWIETPRPLGADD